MRKLTLMVCLAMVCAFGSCSKSHATEVAPITEKTDNEIAASEQDLVLDGPYGKIEARINVPAHAEGAKVPMVILMHGFMSNMGDGIMGSVAYKLGVKGIATIRFSFDGHGKSEGGFQNMTVSREVNDAKFIYEYVRALPYVGEIALCGHSQGGVVTSLTAGELGSEAISRIVLMAPAAVLHDDALKGYVFGKNYDPVNVPEFVELFGDLRLGRDFIVEAQKLDIYATALKYTGPACVIHGAADPIVPISYGQRYAEGYKDAEWHPMEGNDHGFGKDFEQATTYAAEFLGKLVK